MKPVRKSVSPTSTRELRYAAKHGLVAGVDEAGVGPLAGPVVAAAVILDPKSLRGGGFVSWKAVRDSKAMTRGQRETVVRDIYARALTVGVGHASVEEIDAMNILQARLLAMRRALAAMKIVPGFALVDGSIEIPECPVPQRAIVGGDASVLSIACASIVAKVTRDGVLERLHEQYPEYAFDKHKGYPTRLHRQLLQKYGPCIHHRKSFAPVRILLDNPPAGAIESVQSVFSKS